MTPLLMLSAAFGYVFFRLLTVKSELETLKSTHSHQTAVINHQRSLLEGARRNLSEAKVRNTVRWVANVLPELEDVRLARIVVEDPEVGGDRVLLIRPGEYERMSSRVGSQNLQNPSK